MSLKSEIWGSMMNKTKNILKNKNFLLAKPIHLFAVCAMLATSCSNDEYLYKTLKGNECPELSNNQRHRVREGLKIIEDQFNEKIPNINERPYTLYEMQITTANQLIYAELANDLLIMDRLVEFYDRAFPFVRHEIKIGGNNSSTGIESVLISSQFLYAITRLSRVLAERLESDFGHELNKERKQRYQTFIDQWLPVVSIDYLYRWINSSSQSGLTKFHTKEWECSQEASTHQLRVNQLAYHRSKEKKGYCNAIVDKDLFIAGIGAELVATIDSLGGSHPYIPADLVQDIRIHTRNLSQLFASRHSKRSIMYGGKKIEVAVFDPGGFDDHPDHAYSGYTKKSVFPGWTTKEGKTSRIPPQPAQGTGWDLSHARRIPIVWDSLRRHSAHFDGTFPTQDQVQQYARQLAYVTFLGNQNNPRFANYFDGSNGWYRVDYANRPDFGYEPEHFSSKISAFGYGFWDEPRLQKLLNNVRKTASSSKLREYEKAAQFIESLGLSFSAPRCEQHRSP